MDEMTWLEMVALEPRLGELERSVLAGDLTMVNLMLPLAGPLEACVGQHADHPRLRGSDAYRVAFGRLLAADEQRRNRRATA